MKPTPEAMVKEIEQLVPVAQTEYEAHQAAIAENRGAAAALLAQVIEVMRPALHALGTVFPVRKARSAVGDHDAEAMSIPRGLLIGDTVKPREGQGEAARLAGRRLYLLEDGRLYEQDIVGSVWPDGEQEWTTLHGAGTVEVREALEHWRLSTILTALLTVVRLSSRKGTIKNIKENTAKLEAVCTLLETK